MKAERFVGDGPPDVPKRRNGVPTDRILDFVRRAARPLAAAGSHLPQGSSLPSGGLLLLLVRVGTKPCRRALLAARQVPAQPFRSLDSATGGAPLRPPFDPLPRYRLFLPIWVALPAQDWLRQFGSSRRPTPTESFAYRGAYHASGLRGLKGRGNLREVPIRNNFLKIATADFLRNPPRNNPVRVPS